MTEPRKPGDRAEEFNDRLERYLVEQTGLPRDTIKAVLDAQARFFVEHRGNIGRAQDLLEDAG
jgi:hypothetical protein